MKERTRRQKLENARLFHQLCEDREAGEKQMVQTILYLIQAQNYYLARIAELERTVAAMVVEARQP